MTMQTDVESVARSLTKAQREWLLSMPPHTDKIAREPCASFWEQPGRLYVEIDGTEHWLGGKHMCSPEGSPRFETGEEWLSELGLAVRAHLKGNQNGN